MGSVTRPRVLCVDNDEDCRVMLSMLLALETIEAKTVGNAAQALSVVRRERFDLYLLDAWLPEIDGFELCRQMRAIDQHTPILFYSGAAYETDRKRAIDAGANAYVVKPEIDDLIETITQLVSQPGNATAKILPFERKRSYSPPFSFEPAAA